nr:hypothetical protein [Moorena sp. SIO3H5]
MFCNFDLLPTTLSIILGISNNLLVADVGDSRIYLIIKKQICQLTEDPGLLTKVEVERAKSKSSQGVHKLDKSTEVMS